jgi:hypothetical protein
VILFPSTWYCAEKLLHPLEPPTVPSSLKLAEIYKLVGVSSPIKLTSTQVVPPSENDDPWLDEQAVNSGDTDRSMANLKNERRWIFINPCTPFNN